MRGIAVAVASVACLLLGGGAIAKSATVRGYVKKDGTYVAPHQRTTPNSTKMDNYSTKGNTNPYTGKEGTVDPWKADVKKTK